MRITDRLIPVKITTNSIVALPEVLLTTGTEIKESIGNTLQQVSLHTIFATYFK